MLGVQKLLDGILRYRATVRSDLVKQFERIRDNPQPTAIFFGCMDSRMMATRVTQTQVGDMFVVRNSGNMIPRARNFGATGSEVSVTTEPAALELAVTRGGIRHVIVCGHADCKAINTLHQLHLRPDTFSASSPMDLWLRANGHSSMQKLAERMERGPKHELQFDAYAPVFKFSAFVDPKDELAIEDKLSQINALQQLENLASHGFIRELLAADRVELHAMWFNIYTGDMSLFSKRRKVFVQVDEASVDELKQELRETTEELGKRAAAAAAASK